MESPDIWISGKPGMVNDLAGKLSTPEFVDSIHLAEEINVGVSFSHTFYPSTQINYTTSNVFAASPYDDIYNKFYILPTKLNIGAVTSTLTEKIAVWNAHFDVQQMTGVSQSGFVEGTNITHELGEQIYPIDFYGFEFKYYDVNVDFNGIPEFRVWLTAETTINPATAVIYGFRSVLFALSPDREFEHTYEFTTRITESFNTEQRAGLTDKFFEYFGYSSRVGEYDRTYYRQLMNAGTLIRYSIPVWEDFMHVDYVASGFKHVDVELGELETRSFYVGHSMLLWTSPTDYEQVKISDIDYELGRIYTTTAIQTSRENFFLMPIRSGVNHKDISLEFVAPQKHVFDCEFRLLEGVEPLNLTSDLMFLEGVPVITKPNYQDKGKESFSYTRDEFEGVGGDRITYLTRGFSKEVKSYVWKCFDRQQFTELRHFIFETRGRWKSFYLPRFGREFVLKEDATINDSQFTLVLPDLTYDEKEFEGVALYLEDIHGQIYIGRISVATNDNGEASISCIQSIPFSLKRDELLHCCIADLVRSTQDKITVKFKDVNDISCKFKTMKVKE